MQNCHHEPQKWVNLPQPVIAKSHSNVWKWCEDFASVWKCFRVDSHSFMLIRKYCFTLWGFFSNAMKVTGVIYNPKNYNTELFYCGLNDSRKAELETKRWKKAPNEQRNWANRDACHFRLNSKPLSCTKRPFFLPCCMKAWYLWSATGDYNSTLLCRFNACNVSSK